MKRNLIRSLKYMVQLCLLFALIFIVMDLTHASSGESLSDIMHSQRGLLLCVVILVLAAAYPYFGFVTRHVKGDIAKDADKIMAAMAATGYRLVAHEGDVMSFRAEGTLKRFTLMWEDGITVAAHDGQLVITGVRSQVVKVEFRLKTTIEQ